MKVKSLQTDILQLDIELIIEKAFAAAFSRALDRVVQSKAEAIFTKALENGFPFANIIWNQELDDETELANRNRVTSKKSKLSSIVTRKTVRPATASPKCSGRQARVKLISGNRWSVAS